MVEKLIREADLMITQIPDFVDYVLSIFRFGERQRKLLLLAFEKKSVNGTLHVQKEYSVFISR